MTIPPRTFGVTLIAGLGLAAGSAIMLLGAYGNMLGQFLCGLGIVFMSISSYLRPLDLSVPLRQLYARSRKGAIGPANLHITLTAGGYGLIVAGSTLRYYFGI